MVFTTSGNPDGSTDWPNASYSMQLDVTSAGANVNYGCRTISSASGHFAVVDLGMTVDLETAQQSQAAFTGAGLKLASVVWNPATEPATTRFEAAWALVNTGTMSQTLGLSYDNVASCFAIWGDFTPASGGAVTPSRTRTGAGI